MNMNSCDLTKLGKNSHVYVMPGIFLRVVGSITVNITLLNSMKAKGAGNWFANTKTYLV